MTYITYIGSVLAYNMHIAYLPEKKTFSQCGQWLVNKNNAWFSKELTSITSNWWQFIIKEGIYDKVKNQLIYR